MKRFLLFSGYAYEASGGWWDFDDSYDTFEQAYEASLNVFGNWSHIVDSSTGKIIEKEEKSK